MEVNTRRTYLRFILMPLLFALTCVGAFAQANSSVTGIITDQSGAAIAGAKLVLTDSATGAAKTTESSETGLYLFPALNAGTYNLAVTAKGFQTFNQNGIVVNVSATFRVDPKLTVGAESTTVTVQADALTVQSDSNVVSTLINEQQITNLATNGRNIVALATLGLGVSGNLPDSNMPTSVGSSFAISFNGLNQAHNVWLIDGGEAYDRGSGGKSSMMPSQDALGEFQIMASNYPPDYGISSGGTVSMSIKRGTQAFHGTLWEFVRNDALQAHNYFDAPGQAKPELRYNIFGGNVGGPLWIPHVYNENKNKTFFFVNEEWRKIVQGSAPAGIHTVPVANYVTAAQDITYVAPAYNSGHQIVVPNPAPGSPLGQAIAAYNVGAATPLVAGQPFPGNVVPGALMDPVSIQFMSTGAIPQANASGDLLSMSVKQPTNVREDLFRIDQAINDKWQLFGHYIGDSVSQTYGTSIWSGDSYPTVGSNFSNPSWSSVIKLTGSITPNVLLEAAFNFNGNKIDIQPSGSAYQKPSGWTGVGFFNGNDSANRLPSVNLGSYGTAYDPWSQPWKNAAMDYAEVFGLSVTHGKHGFKFGGGYNRYTKNQQLFGNTNGYFNFSDNWDVAAGKPTVDNLTGDSYIDFLLGLSNGGYNQLQTQDIRHYVNQTTSVYAMDNWHVSPRLSIQYGIRYDALPHAWERNNLLASFDPSQYQSALAPTIDPGTGAFCTSVSLPSCPTVSSGLQTYNGAQFYLNGVTIAGQGGTPPGMTKNYYDTWMPRLGFSYDVTGDGKTVVRSGFGTFFERMQGNDVYNIAGSAPFSNNPSLNQVTFANPYISWKTGAALSQAQLPVVPQGPTTIAPYYPAPAVAQFSLGIQRELAPALVLATQYVGNIGWHQNVILPINEFPLTTPLAVRKLAGNGQLTSAQTTNLRTFAGFNNIREETNIATTSYNSFQIGLRQQSRHGLSFEVDYTYGHQIDDQLGSADLTQVSNPFNLKYDKGSGNLDRRQIFNVNYVWDIPLFAHSTGFAHTILGGWTLSGTVISQTGLPWAGQNAPGSGYADTVGLGGDYTNRANMTGKVKYPKTRDSSGAYHWVSPDGFSQPIAAWDGGPNLGFGNAGRDIVVGPGRTNFGTNLYKAFQIREAMHFEFRAETFNTFNHTQFNGFHNSVSGSDFGVTNSVQDPRTWELAGKFVF